MRSKLLAFLMALAADPYSWAALAVIVIIGVLAYYFWDEIKAVLEAKDGWRSTRRNKKGKNNPIPILFTRAIEFQMMKALKKI